MSQLILAIPRLELLYRALGGGVRSQHDLALVAVHAMMLGQDLLLLRIGDDVAAAAEVKPDTDGRPTELLLDGWNVSQDTYTLIYQKGLVAVAAPRDVYLLKALKIGGGLHISVLRWKDQKVASLSIEVADYVTEDWSSPEKAYRNTGELARVITEELLQPFSNSESTGVKKDDSEPQPKSPTMPTPSSRIPPLPSDLRSPPRRVDPFEVGRNDLDPLGGAGSGGFGGGGMLMDPMRAWRAGGGMGPFRGGPPGAEFVPGGLPRGAVPPGARYDPFGPPLPPNLRDERPRPGGARGPDPDHMPPPGYGDMFM